MDQDNPIDLVAYRRIEYHRIEGMKRESNITVQGRYYHESSFSSLNGGSLPNVKQWMINRYFELLLSYSK